MPRDSQGGFNLPTGTLVNSGDTVLVSQHNPAMQDIAEALANSLDRNGTGGMRANLNLNGRKIVNGAPGTAPGDFATLEQAAVPIGVMFDFAGAVAPTGYLMCYGQAISRADYSALYAVLGVQYGAGNGTTTFNLPDCRGRVSAGRDDMGGTAAGRLTTVVSGATLGATGGDQSHTLTADQMPSHNHGGSSAPAGDHSHTLNGGYSMSQFGYDGGDYGAKAGSSISPNTSSAGIHNHDISISAAGGGSAHNNVQPTIIFNKIIRVGNI